MKFMDRVLERIEKDNYFVIDFDIDKFSKIGDKAAVVGLTRYHQEWLVEVEFEKWVGSSETITLLQYMDKTYDIQ